MREWVLSPGFLLAGGVIMAITALVIATHLGGAL